MLVKGLYCLYAFGAMVVLTSLIPKNFLGLRGACSAASYYVVVLSLVIGVPGLSGLVPGVIRPWFFGAAALVLAGLVIYVYRVPLELDWRPIYRRVLLHQNVPDDESKLKDKQ